MRKILAGVAHWDGGAPKNGDIEGLIRWMKIHRDPNIFYHFFISGDRVIYADKDFDHVYYHTGHIQYTELATELFGDYHAPRYTHTRETPHKSSPNFVTFGGCIMHDKKGGGYTEKTIKTAAKAFAAALYKYGLTEKNLLRHTDIVGRKVKDCPRFYVRHPLAWMRFKFLVKREIRKIKKGLIK